MPKLSPPDAMVIKATVQNNQLVPLDSNFSTTSSSLPPLHLSQRHEYLNKLELIQEVQ